MFLLWLLSYQYTVQRILSRNTKTEILCSPLFAISCRLTSAMKPQSTAGPGAKAREDRHEMAHSTLTLYRGRCRDQCRRLSSLSSCYFARNRPKDYDVVSLPVRRIACLFSQQDMVVSFRRCSGAGFRSLCYALCAWLYHQHSDVPVACRPGQATTSMGNGGSGLIYARILFCRAEVLGISPKPHT